MSGSDPRHLLGGVAPDILTPEERRAIYAAALEDQALFDALGDEEALRELLADPAVRARLREALAPKVVPLWRRPALLGVAASLLLAGLATLAVRRNRVEVPKLETPTPAAPAQAAPAPAQAPEAAAPVRKRHAVPPAAATPAPAPAPVPAPPPTPAPTAAAEMQTRADRLAAREKKAESERQEAPKPQALELPERSKTRIFQDAANLAPGVTTGAAAGAVAKAAAAPRPAPAPAWSLEDLGGGRLRLTVVHASARPLVLLRRAPEGVQVLAPLRAEEVGADRRSTFVFTDGADVAVDLYVLTAPVPHPETLPAEGPLAGTRIRVFPRRNPSNP